LLAAHEAASSAGGVRMVSQPGHRAQAPASAAARSSPAAVAGLRGAQRSAARPGLSIGAGTVGRCGCRAEAQALSALPGAGLCAVSDAGRVSRHCAQIRLIWHTGLHPLRASGPTRKFRFGGDPARGPPNRKSTRQGGKGTGGSLSLTSEGEGRRQGKRSHGQGSRRRWPAGSRR
jgi:hypothetical protein